MTLIIAVILVFFDLFYNTKERFYKNLIESIKKENYKGFVIDKYYDRENHNDPILLLKNGEKISVYGIIWSEINIGDSIVKNNGDIILTIFTKDKKNIYNIKNLVDKNMNNK
ncbi:hypothetical protein [Flavobacterium columnare]|uniref:hypothetical protein n=1 Tax=Flavobacterium columnare TaxID=996 RepID=UPI0011BE72B7|nr:hypothetical protein [Flavobacterium columnare]